MEKDRTVTASDLAKSIEEEFRGVNGPVTVEHFASLYGVIAAQMDATEATIALAMKANPNLVADEVAAHAMHASKYARQSLADALKALAGAYGNTEGPEANK